MELTMIDGKVCQALTGTPSTMTSYICKATPKEMNNLDTVKAKVVDWETYEFGLSTLHARLHFMGNILEISYRLEFKNWRVSSDSLKEMKENAKNRICEDFRRRTGLVIHQVKQGSGTSNDGNTARRFFADPQPTSDNFTSLFIAKLFITIF